MKENTLSLPLTPPTSADSATEAELRETEELLRSFRLSPMPAPAKRRMYFTLLQQRNRFSARFRYPAAAASLLLLAVVALGLHTAGDAFPAYVPICACMSGLLLLTSPCGRLQVGHCRIL